MPSFKIAILEKDGTEYGGVVEYDLFQALTELGVTTNTGFSYKIVEGVLTVPYNQQMLVYQEVEITNTGELDLQGELVVL